MRTSPVSSSRRVGRKRRIAGIFDRRRRRIGNRRQVARRNYVSQFPFSVGKGFGNSIGIYVSMVGVLAAAVFLIWHLIFKVAACEFPALLTSKTHERDNAPNRSISQMQR
jgi:hypothetical protein